MATLLAAAAGHTSVQWTTLVWVVGAAVAATVIITVIVVVSRRPKSMEDGMAEFSRSLQAVAPTQHLRMRSTAAHPRAGTGKFGPQRPVRAARGETEAV
ncbi:MAG: hypothetical protein ACRDZX_07895 [Acidimicrobiales bacterium]